MWIWDTGWKKIVSGIRVKHPRSATLVFFNSNAKYTSNYFYLIWFLTKALFAVKSILMSKFNWISSLLGHVLVEFGNRKKWLPGT
jgi:hypothetical protein